MVERRLWQKRAGRIYELVDRRPTSGSADMMSRAARLAERSGRRTVILIGRGELRALICKPTARQQWARKNSGLVRVSAGT